MIEVVLLEGGPVVFGAVPGQIREVVRAPRIVSDRDGREWLDPGDGSPGVPYCSLAALVGRSGEPAERAVLALGRRGRLAYGATGVGRVVHLAAADVAPLPPLLRAALEPRGLLGVALLAGGPVLLADLSLLHPAAHEIP